MRSRYNVYTGVKPIRTRTAIAFSTLGLVLAAGVLPLIMASPASASVTNVNGCSFDESGTTWTLQSSCSSTAEIYVPGGVTLDGGGYTISPTFSKTSPENNAALGVVSSNVTIENLIENGTYGTDLHGIVTYVATGISINNVTLKNNAHDGMVVDGASVTVDNITTMNNGWGGIDVDQGSGVKTPAVLTVNGTSTQTEAHGVDIFVDDTAKNVSVVDTNSQYSVTDYPPAAVYTLLPTSMNECKDGGWQYLAPLKNQGACVSYVASNGKS